MGRHKKVSGDKKICTKCKIEKKISEFRFRKDAQNYISTCKHCENEYSKKYESSGKRDTEHSKKRHKTYYKNNIEECKKSRKENYNKNSKKIKEKRDNNIEESLISEQKYRDKNRDRIRELDRGYREENKEEFKLYNNNYKKERRKNDSLYKLKGNIGNLIRDAFAKNGYKKNSHTYEILGCSYEEFKSHIENQWSLSYNLDENGNIWMNWKNYGKYKNDTFNYGWDLDHIIPISSANSENIIYELNNHKNIQPLCSKINRDIKRNRLDYMNEH